MSDAALLNVVLFLPLLGIVLVGRRPTTTASSVASR
jgi:hypothetical protein